jgi:hypothetical protein
MATVTITGNTIRGATASKDNRTWQIRAVAYQPGGTGGGVITPGADWETLYPVDGVLTFTAEAGSVVDIKTPEGVPYRIRIPNSNAGLWDTIEAGVAYQPDVAQDNLNRAVANAAPGFIAAELGQQTADAITTDLDAREIGFVDDGEGEGHFTITAPDGAVVNISGTLVPPSAAWSSLAGRPHISARDFGATGDGVTDDTANIHAARNAAGVGGKVFFPAGTYLVDELTASVDNQTWTLPDGATLKMATGSSAVVTITGDGVTIEGGTLDASNGTEHDWSQHGVYISGDDATLRNVTILDSPKIGVRGLDCGGTTIEGCTITDSYSTGVFIQNLTGEPVRYNYRVTGNTITTTSIYGAGIGLMAVDANSMQDVHVLNNVVRVPRDSGQVQSLIGVWQCENAVIDGNHLDGGWAGISNPGPTRQIISNNVIRGFWRFGIEVPGDLLDVIITGNSIDMDGVAEANASGISGSAGTGEHVVISNNGIGGSTTATGYGITLSSVITGLVISGNAISNVSARLDGIVLTGNKAGVTITGNVIDANSVDPSYGIQTVGGAFTGMTISGNVFQNIVSACVNLSTSSSATYADVTITGNTYSNCGPTVAGGGATAGTRIVTDSTPPTAFTATAAGITVMTADSAEVQVFTGSTTQNCHLPYTNIKKGQRFTVVNASTGTVTVKEGVGGATVKALTAGSWGVFMALQSTPTTAAHWSYSATAP